MEEERGSAGGPVGRAGTRRLLETHWPGSAPIRRSWQLAWPLVLSNISVPLLGMVDTGVVGHLPEPRHLEAVALGATTVSVLYFLCGFLRMGTTALTAQALGAAAGLELRAVLVRGLLLAAGLGLVIAVAAPIVAAGAAIILAPPPAALGEFRSYVLVRSLGAPAGLAQLVVLGWLLGLQDARRPLVLMLVTNIFNAGLAVFFVFGLGYEAAGVAAAAVVGELVGAALGFVIVWQHLAASGGLPPWAAVLTLSRFRRLILVNRDLFLRSCLLEGAFVVLAAVGSREGGLVLAANAVLLTFFTLAAYGLDGFAYATEAMVGRAVGAADPDELRAAVSAGFVNALVLAFLLTAGFAVGGTALVSLITDQPAVRATAGIYLPWAVLVPAVSIWAFLYDGVFFGATRTAELRNGMLIAVGFFLASSAILVPFAGNHGLWLAFLAFLAGRGLILAWIYARAGGARAFALGASP